MVVMSAVSTAITMSTTRFSVLFVASVMIKRPTPRPLPLGRGMASALGATRVILLKVSNQVNSLLVISLSPPARRLPP